jgi:hypothetical protein
MLEHGKLARIVSERRAPSGVISVYPHNATA